MLHHKRRAYGLQCLTPNIGTQIPISGYVSPNHHNQLCHRAHHIHYPILWVLNFITYIVHLQLAYYVATRPCLTLPCSTGKKSNAKICTFHSIPKCWSCGCTSLIGVIDTHLIMGTAKGPWTNKRIEWRQRLTTNNEIILLLPTILRNRCEWHQIAARDQSGNQSPERNEIHVRTREGLYPSHCSVE